MKKLLMLSLLLIPSVLQSQELKISRLGDNMANQSTTIESSVHVIKLKYTKATDEFGSTNSPKALLTFSENKNGIALAYDIGLGLLATDSVSSVYPVATFSANLPHKWDRKNPFSFGANVSYAPLDDIARFSRANVGVGTFNGNGEVFVKQKIWLRSNLDYKLFTDSNRKLTSTFNARYFNSNGLIYGAQFYRQTYKFDANTGVISGYWSPDLYTSETAELGYKRPWNSKVTGQVVVATGYQQINRDNSLIGSIQADIKSGPLSVWGNYASNGAVSGMAGYKWWTLGTSLKF